LEFNKEKAKKISQKLSKTKTNLKKKMQSLQHVNMKVARQNLLKNNKKLNLTKTQLKKMINSLLKMPPQTNLKPL